MAKRPCDYCHGSGTVSCERCDDHNPTCPACGGHGKHPCPACKGKGKVDDD